MSGGTLGPYRLERELGAGGMGTVYRAVRLRAAGATADDPGGVIALKIVHPHLLATPGFFKRFLREAEIGKRIRHENVVATLDVDAIESDGRVHHFLAMEYVEGQTLRALLDELERVPEELCRHIGREVAKGLAAIHAAGVVHRDVKPENVLITKDHVVKVMDLGVARLADESLRLSQSGAFVGSVQYAAPEQFGFRSAEGATEAIPRSPEGAKGDAVDHRADLHALGLILYELSTSLHPYKADDFRGVMRRVLDEKPRRPAEINPQLSPFFEELTLRLLAKDRDARFASAAELALVLDEGERSAWWHARAKAIRVETKRPLRRIRIPRETALYGRDAELAKLRALYDAAKAGDGRVVLVEGEAGIGKSRLVDEFVGALAQSGEDVNFLFGSYPPGGAATASGAFSTAYREQFGETGSAAYLVQTPLLVPAFDALLSGDATPAGAEPLTKDSLQTVFVHATRALAVERPTIVLIDDLHFAPEEGRALFAALAMAVPGHRVLLVGTTRPGLDGTWLANMDRVGAARLALPRLGPKDLGRLLIDALKSEHTANALALQIATKSDGNPFFVFEILRGLRDGQFLTKRDDGTWATTRVIDEIEIPSSVLELVNARVADLDEDERNLLDVAACVGFEFDPLLVATALGMAPVPAMQKLARIEKKHRLVRSAGRRLVFDHHQVQEALYGALLEPLREAYHAALAAALEAGAEAAGKDPADLHGALCVDLCGHFLKGARGDRALRYLEAAHAHLVKGYVNGQAVALTDAALAVPGLLAGAQRAATLLRLCEINGPLDRLGRRARQEEAAQEAERLAEAAGAPALQAQSLVAGAHALKATGRNAESEASFRRAQEIACANGETKIEGAAESGLGAVFVSQGRFAESRRHFERALALSGATGNRQGEASALGNLGTVSDYEGRTTEARRLVEGQLEISREIGHRPGEAAATGNLGNMLCAQGRPRDARRLTERQLAIFREIGIRQGEAIALHNLGNVDVEDGDDASARERWNASLAIREAVGDRRGAAVELLTLGILDQRESNERRAREGLTKARDEASIAGATGVEILARCHLACLPGGDPKDAAARLLANDARLTAEQRRESRMALWRATRDASHLVEAKRLLDEAVADVPDDVRASMLANVRLNREIVAAAKAAGL